MSRGPNGERRPADMIGCTAKVAKIATGEVEDTKLNILSYSIVVLLAKWPVQQVQAHGNR